MKKRKWVEASGGEVEGLVTKKGRERRGEIIWIMRNDKKRFCTDK